jgi:hypothetical protein
MSQTKVPSLQTEALVSRKKAGVRPTFQPSNGSTGEPDKCRSQTKVPSLKTEALASRKKGRSQTNVSSLQTEALVSRNNPGVRPRFHAFKQKHW